MADSKSKDLALAGGAALVLYLLLGRSGTARAATAAGTMAELVRCEVFLRADGSLRVNGKDSTLDGIKRTCAKRIEVRASGAAKQGDLDSLRRELRSRGFEVVSK